MMARYTSADVIVVGLIGERGREVKEFIERILGPEGRRRAVVVATPADNPPLMRLHGAWRATAIAEYFREQGKSVLLLMDSLTRVAQAQREIGLAIGEAPATKGYPPSVFARLPLSSNAPATASKAAVRLPRSIRCSRKATINRIRSPTRRARFSTATSCCRAALPKRVSFPAIDVEASISRAMHDIVPKQHSDMARRFRQTLSTYTQNRDLIAIGAYQKGSDPRIDAAIAAWPNLQTLPAAGYARARRLHSEPGRARAGGWRRERAAK